jgi:hypothetical protein
LVELAVADGADRGDAVLQELLERPLGVKVIPYLSFYGADREAAYFQHAVTQEPVVLDEIDSVVVCHGANAAAALDAELAGLEIETRLIGDCLTPRTAEEAVYEGLLAGVELGA